MRFRMNDGTVVNTEKASMSWTGNQFFDGSNLCCKHTGTQYTAEDLYRSSKGRYYIVTSSIWQDAVDSARFISKEHAAAWILVNGDQLPEDLKDAALKVEE